MPIYNKGVRKYCTGPELSSDLTDKFNAIGKRHKGKKLLDWRIFYV